MIWYPVVPMSGDDVCSATQNEVLCSLTFAAGCIL